MAPDDAREQLITGDRKRTERSARGAEPKRAGAAGRSSCNRKSAAPWPRRGPGGAVTITAIGDRHVIDDPSAPGDRLRMSIVSYRRYRFPPEIIQHAVWLYFRFPLSYRNVEDLLAERGIDLSYETVRRWALKFGRLYAQRLRRRRPRPSGRWHLDEVFARIGGQRVYLWRAVDDEGEVLDILVQRKRDRRAALKLMRKLLRKQGFAPEAWITDKLASYGSALRNLGMSQRHITGGRINNRAENSHLPVRQRERRMLGFKTPASAQRFLSTHSAIYNTFNVQRHLISRPALRILRDRASETWQNVVRAA
jgi:putative transposase